jgi:hypothetical protein
MYLKNITNPHCGSLHRYVSLHNLPTIANLSKTTTKMVIQWSKSGSSSNITKGYLGSGDNGSSKMKPASAHNVFKHYGKHLFAGKLADHYLTKHGKSGKILDDPSWVKDKKLADIVAAAVLDW